MLSRWFNSGSKQKMTFIVILSVLFQIYLAAFLTLNSNAINQSNWLSELLGDKVLVCSEEGFKWVSASAIIAKNKQQLSKNDYSHQPVKFQCPLLDAFKYPILFFILLITSILAWLSRTKAPLSYYVIRLSLQKVCLQLAPKQSPPIYQKNLKSDLYYTNSTN